MKKIITIVLLMVVVGIVSAVVSQSLTPPSRSTQNVGEVSFDGLLRKYVEGDQVDYLEWKKNDFASFERYLKDLEDVSLDNFGQNEKKAFWINTYNALTIYAVLKRIPSNQLLAKVFSVQMVAGFFDKIQYVIAGESLTLNDIENKKLREGFNDPRIHFAIVCASRSCPAIQNTAFSASDLDERLDEATRQFLTDDRRNRFDKEKKVAHLSEIFRWYEDDFVKDSGSVLEYIQKYLPSVGIDIVSHQIKYLFYDWLVNIKR